MVMTMMSRVEAPIPVISDTQKKIQIKKEWYWAIRIGYMMS
jgi:hypothetical protein